MTHTPAVSVLLPVYNAERFLREAIESVLGQTFEDFELLAYDDGSSDGSLAILRELARRDLRLRVFAMEHRGHGTWLQAGLEAAAAPLVARMDADDACLPHRLARQVSFLGAHPDVVAVGSDYENIDAEGEVLGISRHDTAHGQLLARMRAGEVGVIGHPTVMLRRAAALQAGGYRARYETTEDLDLWFRIAREGRLANLPEVLLRYRHHGQNVGYTLSARQRPLVIELVNDERAREGLPALPPSRWEEVAEDPHLTWAGWALRSGHRRTARKHAARARQRRPRDVAADVLWCLSFLPAPLGRQLLRGWSLLTRR